MRFRKPDAVKRPNQKKGNSRRNFTFRARDVNVTHLGRYGPGRQL